MNIFDFYKQEFKSGKVAIVLYRRHHGDQFFCATSYAGFLKTALTIIEAIVQEDYLELPVGPEPKYSPSITTKQIESLPEKAQKEMRKIIEQEERAHASEYMNWKYKSDIQKILEEKNSIAALKLIQSKQYDGSFMIEFVEPNA